MNPENPASVSDARNASLADLAALLRDQQARKVDVVAPASAIRARAGQLVVSGHHAGAAARRREPDQRHLHPD